MNPNTPKTSTGSPGYTRIVTLLLLALGVAAASAFYLRHARTSDDTPVRQRIEIQEHILKGLAKSGNRLFSDEQVALLKRELSHHKGEIVAIECPMDDLKACYLALEMNLVFEASGWIVEEFLFAARRTSGETVILRVRDDSVLDRARRLSRLFASVGVSVTTQIDPEQLFDLKIIVPARSPQV